MSSTHKEKGVDFEAAKTQSLWKFFDNNVPESVGQTAGSGMRYKSCPACGPRKGWDVSITTEFGSYRCWSCGDTGSIIDAAKMVWSCNTLKEAAEKLLQGHTGAVNHAVRQVDYAAIKAIADAKTAKMRQALGLMQKSCRQYENAPGPLSYLINDRKIPEWIVRQAQRNGMIGFLPSHFNECTDFLISSVGEDLLRETGLWKPDKSLPGIAHRPLVFFLPGLSSAEFRLAIAEVPDGWLKSIRYGALEYPHWWKGDNPQCMLVEGAIDMYSAVALGFTGSVMGLTGCNTFKEEWLVSAFKTHGLKRYVVCLDNDVDNPKNPGQTWAAKLIAMMEALNLPCTNKVLEKGDLNELLKLHANAS